MIVTLGPLVFNDMVPDSNGCIWLATDWEGWDAPDIRQSIIEIPDRDGGYLSQSAYGTRPLTLSGVCKAPDESSFWASYNYLSTIISPRDESIMTVAESVPKFTRVVRSGGPRQRMGGGSDFEWEINLLAVDPFKYGELSVGSTGLSTDPLGGLVFPLFPSGVLDFGPASTPGVLSINNAGTAPASIVFTVTGPTPSGGFIITDLVTGKRITYSGEVPSGSTLVLDSTDGSIIINGTADRSGDTVVEAWPSVPAQSSKTFLFTPQGAFTAATLTASAYSTYL